MDLEERLISINSSLGTVGEGKINLANMLYETKASVYWPDTKYEHWKTFCSREIALSHATIYVYLRTVKLALDNKFREADTRHIVNTIGWERYRLGLTKIVAGDVVNVVKFIKMFKDLNLNERVTYDDSDSKLVSFTFSIPQESADDLTNELLTRGMRISNKSRTNASSAMVKLIKDFVKE